MITSPPLRNQLSLNSRQTEEPNKTGPPPHNHHTTPFIMATAPPAPGVENPFVSAEGEGAPEPVDPKCVAGWGAGAAAGTAEGGGGRGGGVARGGCGVRGWGGGGIAFEVQEEEGHRGVDGRGRGPVAADCEYDHRPAVDDGGDRVLLHRARRTDVRGSDHFRLPDVRGGGERGGAGWDGQGRGDAGPAAGARGRARARRSGEVRCAVSSAS
jgi:hypothetical protein